MKANGKQIGGDHYKSDYQHWDWVLHVHLPYLPAQVTKYLSRWRKKNGLQDLKKADHFLDKFMEAEEARQHNIVNRTAQFVLNNEFDKTEEYILKKIISYHIGNHLNLVTASEMLKAMIQDQEKKTTQQ